MISEEALAAALEAEGLIAIPKKVYEDLKADEEFLNALHAAGVDNWDFYDEVAAGE